MEKKEIEKIPKHVVIVMDGNGRWAKKRHLPRIAGHKVGAERVRDAVKFCIKNKIEVLTLFAFSMENWQRPKEEVNFLMGLFLRKLSEEVKELHENNVQICFIGNRISLDVDLQKEMEEAEKLTASNSGLKLVLAINYSGQWDITNAAKKIAQKVLSGRLSLNDVTEQKMESNISLHGMPSPDLFIRTSGEKRISNFLLWQLAYTELYFTDVLWPDFDENEFKKALVNFSARERRFGKV
jgi:undecaprenyl diphosphate synthase